MADKISRDITDKEWLDLAWKYFQQHAQQRVSYFNYFVIFSTLLTTGFITTFQPDYTQVWFGIPLGFIQSFLAFMFLKIDKRNSFLTKQAEKNIIRFERHYALEFRSESKLFTTEKEKSDCLLSLNKRKFFLFQQFSHGMSYRIIYTTFLIVGLLESFYAFLSCKG